jgi:hypothetical protein
MNTRSHLINKKVIVKQAVFDRDIVEISGL